MFKAKYLEHGFHGTGPGHWIIVDDSGETVFGDNQPRDQREAEQCARAANLAIATYRDDMLAKMRRVLDER